MNDFTRTKIEFALAILVALFTIWPMTGTAREWGFAVFGLSIQIYHLYLLTSLLLALSVYVYSFQFLSESPRPFIQQFADVVYATAIISPLLFVGLWISTYLAGLADALISYAAPAQLLSNVLGVIVGVASAYFIDKFRSLLRKKNAQAVARAQELNAVSALDRAKTLYADQHYDLAVIEAFRAVEISLRRTLEQNNVRIDTSSSVDLIDSAFAQNLVPESRKSLLHNLRRSRNRAMHGKTDITANYALVSIEAARRILASLSGDQSNDNIA